MGDEVRKNTLGAKERLKHKKHFEQVFQNGRSLVKSPVSLIFIELSFTGRQPVKAGFSVPKRKFKRAADRNKLKRRLKEAYRQNKHLLYDTLTKNGKQIGMVFVYTGKEPVSYKIINEKIILLLQEITQQF